MTISRRLPNTYLALSRRNVIAGLGAGLFVGATGARVSLAQAAAAIKPGGTMIVGINADPPALSILGSNATLTNCTSGQIHSTLITLSREGKPQPSLAKSWNISDDGLTYMFHLEEGVKWHDGVPFTSDDIRFSMMELNGKYVSLAKATLAGVESIETPDVNTVVVKLGRPDPAFFPWAFSQQEQAQIHARHIYENSDVTANPANLKPVGTGAYKFVEWESGSHITLEKNPDYFHMDQVFLDRVVFQVIPDAGARQLALENGDVDYIPFFGMSAASADTLQADANVQVFNSVRPARGLIMAYMNLRHEQLTKKEVRQALSYAIDREKIVKLALNGRGKAATSPIRSDDTAFYNPEVMKYPTDPDKANKILDDAGVTANGSTRFSIRLAYQSSGEGGALQSAGEIMRENLRAIGVELQLTPGDFATVWDNAYLKWDFDLAMASFFTGPDPKISVSPKYITENIQKVSGGNLMGYSNPKVDALLNAADVEMSPDKRKDLYGQAQAILVEEIPALWIWEKIYPSAARANITGLPSGMNHWEPYENVGFTS